MNEEQGREASWAYASDKLGRWLLHLPSGVVGKVGKVYAPGEYEPVKAPGVEGGSPSVAVLEFEDGNSFLADPKNFQVLSPGDVKVFKVMSRKLRALCVRIVEASRGDDRGESGYFDLRTAQLFEGSTPESVAAVIRAALSAQVRALAPR